MGKDRESLEGYSSSFEGEYDASPEEHPFDELARGVVDGTLSRAKALKSVGAATLGALLGVFALPRDAEAADLKTLWAIVNENGPLERGKGITSVSKPATGEYTIKFSQDVSRCASSATLRNGSGFVFLDTIRTGDPLTRREVGLTTLNRDGVVRDTAFHLVVNC
jgi:hypothetical protein